MSKLRCEECLLERERNNELQAELAELRERVEELEEVGGTKIAELEAELAELKKQ